MKIFNSAVMLTCLGLTTALPATEKKLWLDLINLSDNAEKERLLAEGIARGMGLPEEWKVLWKNDALKPWLLQVLPYDMLKELPPLSEWSPSLRTQCWHRAQQEAWGGDDLLQKAQAFLPKADGGEKIWLQQLLKSTPPEWKEAPSAKDSPLLISQKWAFSQSLGEQAITQFKSGLEACPDHLKVVVPEALSDELLHKMSKDKEPSIAFPAYGEKWKRKLDWLELLKQLKEKSWPIVDTVVQVLRFHRPVPEVKMFSDAWENQGDAGRFALAMWISAVEHRQLSDYCCSALLKNQGGQLCLVMLQSMGPHGKSDWLINKLMAREIAKSDIEKSLAVLLAWDEVSKNRDYVKFYIDEGYRKGGPGGNELLLLMGKSQHEDAEKILASHFKASETNPYSLDTVVEASAYHGSPKLRQQIKSAMGSEKSDFTTWALNRSEGKIQTNWLAPKSESQVMTSFKSLVQP